MASCVLSKNKPLYISLLLIRRGLVKLTPTWVSWERGRASYNLLMDAIMTLSFCLLFLFLALLSPTRSLWRHTGICFWIFDIGRLSALTLTFDPFYCLFTDYCNVASARFRAVTPACIWSEPLSSANACNGSKINDFPTSTQKCLRLFMHAFASHIGPTHSLYMQRNIFCSVCVSLWPITWLILDFLASVDSKAQLNTNSETLPI